MLGISQSSDDCYYDPYNIADDHCQNGQCYSLADISSSKSLSLQTSILIGIGVSAVCIVCLTVGALYWHRRQINSAEKRLNMLTSFSLPTYVQSVKGTSAGVRIHSSTSQPSLVETSVNLEPTTSAVP
ncbi:unnamed protein product [Rotaria sp. Silwood2]|nr:unnamed protein product [Rotaria sp. Silwood2]CAF2721567.1 unnamed protein product [Rotaria sp. Silwood2]CAF2992659.1 unnamed protein product [Rotaria sp. Silwood2]CAF3141311.1 unnamed protein product [Rotaria sp. Silwood2]CAF3875610.1 unnamed protein product [Rotaria sp. Silwood2]